MITTLSLHLLHSTSAGFRQWLSFAAHGPVDSAATFRIRGISSKVPASGASWFVIASSRRRGMDVDEGIRYVCLSSTATVDVSLVCSGAHLPVWQALVKLRDVSLIQALDLELDLGWERLGECPDSSALQGKGWDLTWEWSDPPAGSWHRHLAARW